MPDLPTPEMSSPPSPRAALVPAQKILHSFFFVWYNILVKI